MRLFALTFAVTGLLSGVVAPGCTDSQPTAPTDGLRIAVAPLTLPSIGKVCYDIQVTNGPARTGSKVWAKGTPGLNGGGGDPAAICSDRYGNAGGGDITYIGPCDADGQEDPGDAAGERTNSVTIWFDGLYDSGGAYIDPAGPNGWQDPCVDASGNAVGCTLDVLCEENADALVAFDFTVMRDANQGFFDVAVNFDDVFCSAKVDCREALLHNGDTRDATVVVGFACTSGVNETSTLHVSDLVLTCDGQTPIVIPANAPVGNRGPLGTAVFDWAVYQGDEDLSSNGEPLAKCYWNRAIGIDRDALSGASCRLSGVATASNDGIAPAAGSTAYPVIRFDVDVLHADRSLCANNALNGFGSGVTTSYVTAASPPVGAEALSATLACAACRATTDATCDGADDDCDGLIDEDYVPTPTTCGVGVCGSVGTLGCVDGVVVDSCVPGESSIASSAFNVSTDANVVHAAVYRTAQHCDDLSGTGPGLLCAPAPGWSDSGGLDDSGYVFGVAKDAAERHYGLTVDTVPRPNLLGGRISGHFRTLAVAGGASVRSLEGAGNAATNATVATARARWIITSRNPQTSVIWIWVSKDSFAWNPNADTTWTEHGVDVVWANFAQWQPFVSSGYPGGSAQQFADSVNNVTRIGVIMSDASINYARHLDASWYRTNRYGVMSASLPNNVELGWDDLVITATGSDCNANGVDDDCNGIIDDCPSQL